jgi:hypothetical protein
VKRPPAVKFGIYFQAYTDRDDELCVTALSRLKLNFEHADPSDV